MKLTNTVQDYLNTINVEAPGITCPACGSVLGIKRQGSTEMILTENVRLELDGYLASYRRFLEKLEMLLEQRSVMFTTKPTLVTILIPESKTTIVVKVMPLSLIVMEYTKVL
jgi:hypothetical protein